MMFILLVLTLASAWVVSSVGVCDDTKFCVKAHDAECCHNPRFVNAGAKNVVFSCGNSPREVRRVSFWGDIQPIAPSSTVSACSACAVDTQSLSDALTLTRNQCRLDHLCSDDLLRAVDDALYVAKLRTRPTDVVSLASWLDEQYLSARAAAAGLSMGVNTALSSLRIPVPLREALLCDSKRGHGSPDMAIATLEMVVERQLRHEQSAEMLSSDPSMSSSDRFVFLHGWISGQIELHAAAGTFHIDGHTGNVLVNGSAFLWNDFGRTTSHPGHPDSQFKTTVASVVTLARKASSLVAVASALEGAVAGPIPLNESEVVSTLSDTLVMLEAMPEMKNTSVLQRLGGRRMGTRVALLEATVAAQGVTIAAQGVTIAAQAATIANLSTDVARLSAQLMQLMQRLPADL